MTANPGDTEILIDHSLDLAEGDALGLLPTGMDNEEYDYVWLLTHMKCCRYFLYRTFGYKLPFEYWMKKTPTGGMISLGWVPSSPRSLSFQTS